MITLRLSLFIITLTVCQVFISHAPAGALELNKNQEGLVPSEQTKGDVRPTGQSQSISPRSESRNAELASGDIPLTNEMFQNFVSGMEWSLEISLLPSEKEQLKRNAIKAWNSNNIEVMRVVVFIGLISRDLPKLNGSETLPLHEIFKAGLLKNMLDHRDNAETDAFLERYCSIRFTSCEPSRLTRDLEDEAYKAKVEEVASRYRDRLPARASSSFSDAAKRLNTERQTERYITNNVLRIN